MFGFHHFDHLGGTLIVLVQYTIPDSAYDPLWAALQSEPDVKGLIWIFFFLISCLNTFIMLGLALAVITGTFNEVVLEDLSRAAVESGQAVLGLRGVRRDSCEIVDEDEDEGKTPASHSGYLQSKSTPIYAWAERIMSDPRFAHAISFVIVTHVVAMAVDCQNSGGSPLPIRVIYMLINVVFAFEWLIQCMGGIGLSLSGSSASFLEFLFLLCGVCGLILDSKPLVLVPVFRLFRLTMYFPTLHALLQSFVSSWRVFVQLLMFTILNFFAFAVLGRYLFRDKLNPLTRSHFGDLGQALLTSFQLFIGDQWRLVTNILTILML
jgi:hypothetical protein